LNKRESYSAPITGKIHNKKRAMKKIYIDEIPSNAKEEILMLYNLGVRIEELEYLIDVKFDESLSESS
jgi:hypothetical protein